MHVAASVVEQLRKHEQASDIQRTFRRLFGRGMTFVALYQFPPVPLLSEEAALEERMETCILALLTVTTDKRSQIAVP